jgi:hypothetical protein
MPQLADRLEHEAQLAGSLSEILALVRQRVDRGEAVPWADLESQARDALEDQLAAAFVVIFLMMADQGLQNDTLLAQSLSSRWARQQSGLIASGLFGNLRREVSSGSDAARVFSGRRAEVIAATEITRAVSAAELEARRVNAQLAAGRTRPAEAPALPPSDRGLTVVQDGLVAVWITERDDRVCPICSPLDRQREESWIGQYPFGPPAHPNCRCYLEYRPRQ